MPGIGCGIGINFNRRGQSWTPQSIVPKMLFWGKVSEISGGQMPNKVTGATDYLTVAGSPATFQCPNTAPYIAADTDYIWFKTDTRQRTVTTAELAGYDFPRTIVKYLDSSPYTIDEIIILKAGESLTTSEENSLRDYMQLSIWWNGVLSLHGSIKGNKPIAQQYTWTPETVTIPTISTATIENAAPANIILTFNHTLVESPVPDTSAFAVLVNGSSRTVNTVAIAGAVVTLTLASNVVNGNTVTVSYTKPATNPLADLTTGGRVASFSDQAVTNNLAKLWDQFTGADSTHLNAHTMNIGAGWSEDAGSWTILSNKATEQTAAGAHYMAVAEAGSAEQDVSVDIDLPAGGAYFIGGLTFRYQDTTHKWRAFIDRENIPAVLNLYLDTTSKGSVAITDDRGTTITLRVVANGNNIKVYYKGVLKIEVNDATYNDKTKVGLYKYRATTTNFLDLPMDNFIVV